MKRKGMENSKWMHKFLQMEKETYRCINMAPGSLVVISHMLERESHTTSRNGASKRPECEVHGFHVLMEI